MSLISKVVKIPVRIIDEDKKISNVKYRALCELMREAQYLGNMAIRYGIAMKLKNLVPPEFKEDGKVKPLDSRIYDVLMTKRKYLDASIVATLGRNHALKILNRIDKDAWAGRKSLPTFKSLFIPFRHQCTKIYEAEINGNKQFIITPQGFGGKWLSDDLVKKVSDGKITGIPNEVKKLVFISMFSWKHKGSLEIISRVVSGEYKLRDSQIQKKTKNCLFFFLIISSLLNQGWMKKRSAVLILDMLPLLYVL